jgi:hypothetical protein
MMVTQRFQLLLRKDQDEGDISPNADTSDDGSLSGKLTKVTTEETSEYLGMDVIDLTPETCSRQYKESRNATYHPDPINANMATLEEEVGKLQLDSKELMSGVAAIEDSPANNGGTV